MTSDTEDAEVCIGESPEGKVVAGWVDGRGIGSALVDGETKGDSSTKIALDERWCSLETKADRWR